MPFVDFELSQTSHPFSPYLPGHFHDFKAVLTFEFVDEVRKCDHSNESYWAVLFCGLFIMLYKVVL